MATQGGTSQQHQKAGQTGHGANANQTERQQHTTTGTQKNYADEDQEFSSAGTPRTAQGGTHEQHVSAGRQSHKNSAPS